MQMIAFIDKMLCSAFRFFRQLPLWMLLAGVLTWQRVVSPMFGNNCRFYPSCSEYARQALQQHGALLGSWYVLRRILRCNSLNHGGIDLVEQGNNKLETN